MTPQLFIHIGPYKTGTTSVQEHFWQNRRAYRAGGLLYPESGIVGGKWGHRHLGLARAFDAQVWSRLVAEIEEANCPKVLVSSERLSSSLTHLAEARPLIERYDPRMIIVLRDEADLVRSMYLQIVKGSFSRLMPPEQDYVPRTGFAEWWRKARHRYVYGRMVQQWTDIFGEDRIIFMVYGKGRRFDVLDKMCKTLDVPMLVRQAKRNPSIGPFAARSAISASRFGWYAGSCAMAITRQLERLFPTLARGDPVDFDPDAIRAYYMAQNQKAVEKFPAFAEEYAALKREREDRREVAQARDGLGQEDRAEGTSHDSSD